MKRLTRRSFTVLLLYLILAVLWLWVGSSPGDDKVQFDNEEIRLLKGEFQISTKDQSLDASLPLQIEAQKGDIIVLKRKLTREDVAGNSILFYVKQAKIKVFLSGLLIYEEPERDLPFPMLSGSYWRLIRLPVNCAGRILTIEITPETDKYAGELPEIYAGNKSALIYMVLKQGALALALGCTALVLGVAVLACSLMIKDRLLAARMYYLGLLTATTSIWELLESRITQLFTGNIARASLVLFSCFGLMPVLISAYLLTYDGLRNKWYIKWIFRLTVGIYLSMQLLQATGVCYYMDMLPLIHLMFILILVGLFAGLLDLLKSDQEKKDFSIYKATGLLGVFGMADIAWFYLVPSGRVAIFMRMGILVFIGYLGYGALRQVGDLRVQEAKQKLYQKLAFQDILTGLKNRTAFEKEMNEIRTEEKEWKTEHPKENWVVLVTDMNGLKKINDGLGHTKGDEAIIRTGSLLKQNFEGVGNCYRIGGDEFCVLSRVERMEDFEEACSEFRAAVRKAAEQTEYPYAVSVGYCVVDESGIDECLKKADRLMYEEKSRSKKQAEDPKYLSGISI